MPPEFSHQFDESREPESFPLPWTYLKELMMDGRTPVRAVSDEAMNYYHRFLLCDGTIYELSAPNDYYKSFFPPDQKYVMTNYADNADIVVDMTDMPFDSDSIDAMLSVFAIEHIEDYRKGFEEVERVLKPGGRFLAIVPFLYYYHAAPDDYVRFTTSYVRSLMSNFNVLSLRTLGSREVMIADMYHEKPWMNFKTSLASKLVKRLFACFIMLKYLLQPNRDNTFYPAVLVLVEKKLDVTGNVTL